MTSSQGRLSYLGKPIYIAALIAYFCPVISRKSDPLKMQLRSIYVEYGPSIPRAACSVVPRSIAGFALGEGH